MAKMEQWLNCAPLKTTDDQISYLRYLGVFDALIHRVRQVQVHVS